MCVLVTGMVRTSGPWLWRHDDWVCLPGETLPHLSRESETLSEFLEAVWDLPSQGSFFLWEPLLLWGRVEMEGGAHALHFKQRSLMLVVSPSPFSSLSLHRKAGSNFSGQHSAHLIPLQPLWTKEGQHPLFLFPNTPFTLLCEHRDLCVFAVIC